MHQRLVFRPHRPHRHRAAVAQLLDRFEMLRVGRDRQARRPGRRRRRDADAGIERDDPAASASSGLMSSSRISGVIGRELPDPDQHLGDRVDCGRRLAAITLQQAPDARPLHLAARQQGIERRQPDRAVAHDLDRGASLAENDYRAEDRVLARSQPAARSRRAA